MVDTVFFRLRTVLRSAGRETQVQPEIVLNHARRPQGVSAFLVLFSPLTVLRSAGRETQVQPEIVLNHARRPQEFPLFLSSSHPERNYAQRGGKHSGHL